MSFPLKADGQWLTAPGHQPSAILVPGARHPAFGAGLPPGP